jgi:chorismate mutase / prephenate dehydratase
VACRLRHEPGALVRALTPVATHGLSITKIEGRPLTGAGFEYRFVIEMVAPEGAAIQPGIYDELRRVTDSLVVLGAFRAGAATGTLRQG